MILKPTDVARADTIRLAIEAAEASKPPPNKIGSTDNRMTVKEWTEQKVELKRALRYVLDTGKVYTPLAEKHKEYNGK